MWSLGAYVDQECHRDSTVVTIIMIAQLSYWLSLDSTFFFKLSYYSMLWSLSRLNSTTR